MVANPERGEASLTINGETYTLKLSMNVAAILQKKHNKPLGKLLAEIFDVDVVAMRAVVWLLLQKYHAKQFPTEEKVGDFIDEAGGLSVFVDAINDVMAVNSSGNGNGTVTGTGGNPQPPGTGVDSTSPLAVSG